MNKFGNLILSTGKQIRAMLCALSKTGLHIDEDFRFARIAFRCLACLLCGLSAQALNAVSITGKVVSTEAEHSRYQVQIIESSSASLLPEQSYVFFVGKGDQSDFYLNRTIEAEAVFYGNQWHLERIFPLDGIGSKAYYDLNEKFHRTVRSISRRNFVEESDYIVSFAGINQSAQFFQFKDFLGKVLVVNFIFTRCKAAEMCPAATLRMARMQDLARERGLENLHFLSISFDPENDSPGILRQYAESYDIEPDTFTFMTSKEQWVEDLMRYFGIITIEEDGTINHTMATLLINAQGRVHYRKEGSTWAVSDFLSRAEALLSP
ncbi:MAG: hypothetical protein CML12_03825 [Puniceicoccaceae bacterium]|nr:hypothetical protein [Puniceicoccaceae bacterium]RCL31383.1 MAG: SCO family protein [Puniceicoccaceae bacterium]